MNSKNSSKYIIHNFANKNPVNFQNYGNQHVISIQNDKRVRMTKIQKPYISIGLLYSKFPISQQGRQKFTLGTAFLIHDNLILTAAHNVYNKDTNNLAVQVYFTPALNGVSKDTYSVYSIYVPIQYKCQNNLQKYQNYDYAMLKLCCQSLARKFFFFAISHKQVKVDEQIIIYGYPYDLNNHQKVSDNLQDQKSNKEKKKESSFYLYGCSDKIIQVQQNRILHKIDTSKGQSGSPMIRMIKKVDNANNVTYQYQVIGIHLSGCLQYNIGLSLNQKIYRRIYKWFKQVKNETNQQNKLFIDKNIISIFDKKTQRLVQLHQGQNQAINVIYDQKYYSVKDPIQLGLYGSKLGSQNRQFQNALKFLQKSINNFDNENQLFLSNILLIKGTFQSYKGNLLSSQNTLKKSLFTLKNYIKKNINSKTFNKNKLILQTTLTFVNLGYVNFNLHKYQTSKKYFKKAQSLIKQNLNENQLNYIHLLFWQAKINQIFKKYQIAINLFKKTLKLSESIYGQNNFLIVQILKQIAIIKSHQGCYNQAIQICKKCCQIYRINQIKNKFQAIQLLSLMASLYQKKGQYQNSLNCLKKNLKLVKFFFGQKSKIEKGLIIKITDLYLGLNKLNQTKMLFEYLQRSYLKTKQIDKFQYNISLIGLDRSDKDLLKQYQKNAVLLNEWLKMKTKKNKQKTLLYDQIYLNLGMLLCNQKKYKEALQYYKKSFFLILLSNKQESKILIQIFFEMAFTYVELKRYKDALFFAKKTLQLSQRFFENKNVRYKQCLKLMIRIHSQRKECDQLQFYVEKTIQFYQKIISENPKDKLFLIQQYNQFSSVMKTVKQKLKFIRFIYSR